MRFSDTKKREWSVAFTCRAVFLLERELGLKSLDFTGHFWPAFTDDRRAVDMIWTLVSEQADRRGVGMMDFLEGLDEASLHQARDALLGEYIGFFRSPTKRSLLESLRSETRRLREAIETALARRLDEICTRSGAGSSSSAAA